MNNDLTEFGQEFVEEESLNRYGVEFEFLGEEAQAELWEEAQQEYEENLISQAEHYNDILKEPSEAEIENYLLEQHEAQQELKSGLFD